MYNVYTNSSSPDVHLAINDSELNFTGSWPMRVALSITFRPADGSTSIFWVRVEEYMSQNTTINLPATDKDGVYEITIVVSDCVNNTAPAQTYYIFKDTQAPALLLNASLYQSGYYIVFSIYNTTSLSPILSPTVAWRLEGMNSWIISDFQIAPVTEGRIVFFLPPA
ncbi:MAG: hypothetical protein QW728_07560, partial [Thermoplasmata archaeon]